MGIYIEPSTTTKEEWLLKHGKRLSLFAPDAYDAVRKGKCVPVCLIDNGVFSSASVAYSKEESIVFCYPDIRQKTWFIVPVESLLLDSGIKEETLRRVGLL